VFGRKLKGNGEGREHEEEDISTYPIALLEHKKGAAATAVWRTRFWVILRTCRKAMCDEIVTGR
jgi:hypothetical protein